MNPWWTDQQAGLVGGIAGSAFGILGGVLGTVAGIYAPKGKCKTLVYAMAGMIVGIGITSLVVGIAAVFLGQPYAVYYPTLLLGVLGTSMVWLFPVIRQRYREADGRRLEAEELRRG